MKTKYLVTLTNPDRLDVTDDRDTLWCSQSFPNLRDAMKDFKSRAKSVGDGQVYLLKLELVVEHDGSNYDDDTQ